MFNYEVFSQLPLELVKKCVPAARPAGYAVDVMIFHPQHGDFLVTGLETGGDSLETSRTTGFHGYTVPDGVYMQFPIEEWPTQATYEQLRDKVDVLYYEACNQTPGDGVLIYAYAKAKHEAGLALAFYRNV